ncbi:MAG: lamin tail domain-containing protein [Congregibacter sp.]
MVHAAQANLLLTEIHYNGPASGTDPDEFLELSNTFSAALSMDGYRFSAGINFEFASGSRLPAQSALVLARDAEAFLSVFPGFSGPVLDFSGALSNNGEPITLLDNAGKELWSVAYEDGGNWPLSADGGGNSLQLSASSTDAMIADQWFAAPPTPGTWEGLSTLPPPSPGPSNRVPEPLGFWMALLGMIVVCMRRLPLRAIAGTA